MRRAILGFAITGSLLLAGPPSAMAIIDGTADSGHHPFVGSVVFHDASGQYVPLCTGTLLAPKVVETAAHCFTFGPGATGTAADWSVVFDSKVGFGSDGRPLDAVPAASYTVHPDFRFGTSDYHDMAVIILARSMRITPARLPAVGALDAMQANGGLKGQLFTEVGYGASALSDSATPCFIGLCGTRLYGTARYQSMTSSWLKVTPAPAAGYYGDSGGPFLIGAGASETRVIAGSFFGGTNSQEFVYRLDTQEAQTFLAPFLR